MPQLAERRTRTVDGAAHPSPYAVALAGLFEQHKQIRFEALERPFNGLSRVQADIAYAESLCAVEYLRSRDRMDDVLRVLRRVGAENRRKERYVRSLASTTRIWKEN